jgi:hypothetical protein
MFASGAGGQRAAGREITIPNQVAIEWKLIIISRFIVRTG